jgi:hypothetical protein
VRVRVTDRTSGVASGVVEMRRGAGAWRRLRTRLAGAELVASVPDGAVPAGFYDFRARVRDAAGNSAQTRRTVDGRPASLRLPLRPATRLVMEAVRVRTGFGRAVTLRGRLGTAAGRPIRAGRVRVYSRERTASRFRRIRTVTTDARGRLAVRVPPGPSRIVRLAYAGTERLGARAVQVAVLVPGRSSIAVDRRRTRNGGAVTFAGRLLGAALPAGGRAVELQAHYRGAWRTFASPRAGRNGRWRFRYRFEATVGRVVYAFRARIQRDATYPYELGYSRVVRVTVVG